MRKLGKQEKAKVGPRGCRLRDRGTRRLQVTLCPHRRFFWGNWHKLSSRLEGRLQLVGKPGSTGEPASRTPPRLPAFPDSGSARGSLLQPSPCASLTGPEWLAWRKE